MSQDNQPTVRETAGRSETKLIARRAHELWVAHGCPPEGAAAFMPQATLEIEINVQIVAGQSVPSAGGR